MSDVLWTPERSKQRHAPAITPIVRALNLIRRVPDHLRKLDLAVDDEAVMIIAMAVAYYVWGAADSIRRPSIATLWRERWPSSAATLKPAEIVALFELEPLLEPDA